MEIKEEPLDKEETKIDMEKQTRMVNRVLIILIIVIILSVGFFLYYQNVRYKEVYFDYNGFPVHRVRQGNIYVYQIEVTSNNQKSLLTARFNPKELEEISFSGDILNMLFEKQEIYVTMPSNATGISILAATEIAKIFGNPNILENPIPVHGALLDPVEGKDVVVKTCDDVSEVMGIIKLNYGSENKVYLRNNCTILEGETEYDFVKLANRLTLTSIGIMK